MTMAGNQPYLFPYIGYWQLINKVDTYVIANNLQYIKGGYINRNHILIQGKKHMFTQQVQGVHLGMLINEVEVGNNAKKILKSFSHAYNKAPYFKEVFPMLEKILMNDEKNLAKYIGYSIKTIAHYLDIDTKFICDSDLHIDPSLHAQASVIERCKKLNVDHYINGIGGHALYNKEDFLKEGIVLNFLKLEEIEYKQFKNEFIPNLSIVDVMMFNSKDEIKKMLTKYTLV